MKITETITTEIHKQSKYIFEGKIIKNRSGVVTKENVFICIEPKDTMEDLDRVLSQGDILGNY
jgi:hypothetical protein